MSRDIYQHMVGWYLYVGKGRNVGNIWMERGKYNVGGALHGPVMMGWPFATGYES